MRDPISVIMDRLDLAIANHARVPDYVYAGPNDPVVWSWGSDEVGAVVVSSAGPVSPAMLVLRQTWRDIRKRCLNPKAVNYRHYGGRGIMVCERWRLSFKAFASDMGERPSDLHSIDRIDVDGHYEPGNCRWATRSVQATNKRPLWRVKADVKPLESHFIVL